MIKPDIWESNPAIPLLVPVILYLEAILYVNIEPSYNIRFWRGITEHEFQSYLVLSQFIQCTAKGLNGNPEYYASQKWWFPTIFDKPS
jgi:hypothetical protein